MDINRNVTEIYIMHSKKVNGIMKLEESVLSAAAERPTEE